MNLIIIIINFDALDATLEARRSYNITHNTHTFNSILEYSRDIELTKLFDDEEDEPNLIYQCHKLVSESSDVMISTVDNAPPTPITVTRKQILKPESHGIDELGYLSQYILEMAQRRGQKG